MVQIIKKNFEFKRTTEKVNFIQADVPQVTKTNLGVINW
jgi:hypothetical protein